MEDTINGIPTMYLHGSTVIHPVLQDQLKGLKAGATKELYLSPHDAPVDDDFCFEIIIDEVREASPEELALGYPLQIEAEKCEADCSCYT